jgi:hypothetical protein
MLNIFIKSVNYLIFKHKKTCYLAGCKLLKFVSKDHHLSMEGVQLSEYYLVLL